MNDIHELRTHLFETLRALKDKDKPMELDRARTISQMAGTIIDSARVEVDFLKATNAKAGTGFIDPLRPPIPRGEDGGPLANGIEGVTRHFLGS